MESAEVLASFPPLPRLSEEAAAKVDIRFDIPSSTAIVNSSPRNLEEAKPLAAHAEDEMGSPHTFLSVDSPVGPSAAELGFSAHDDSLLETPAHSSPDYGSF